MRRDADGESALAKITHVTSVAHFGRKVIVISRGCDYIVSNEGIPHLRSFDQATLDVKLNSKDSAGDGGGRGPG